MLLRLERSYFVQSNMPAHMEAYKLLYETLQRVV
jgi:hypothetical protein